MARRQWCNFTSLQVGTKILSGGGIDSFARNFFDKVILYGFHGFAVPVFLMISGSLLLDPKRQADIQKIKRYIWRMAMVLLTFGLCYCLLETFFENGLRNPIASVGTAALNLLQGHSWAHMWYVYALIGLYLLTPMLRAFISGADKQTIQFTLIVLFVLTNIRPMFNSALDIELAGFVPISAYTLFFYIAGYAITCFGINSQTAGRLLFVGLIGYFATLAFDLINGAKGTQCGANAFASCYAVGLFALAQNSAFLENLMHSKLMQSVSRYSFGIYLIHPLFINVFYKVLYLHPGMLPFAVGEFVFTTITILLSWAASAVLCRLPFFRRILA